MNAQKKVLSPSFFSAAKCDIMSKGYKVIDSFTDDLPPAPPPRFCASLNWDDLQQSVMCHCKTGSSLC